MRPFIQIALLGLFVHMLQPAAFAAGCGVRLADVRLDCRHFNGYKPCPAGQTCTPDCQSFKPIENRIAIVHLEALGAVLRSTALLPAIKRKYPNSTITWITKAPAHQLLANNPMIDRVLTLSSEDLLKLRVLRFDFAFVIDKSLAAAGLARELNVDQIRGFIADENNGAIIPANIEAEELWRLGLSNQAKFFENTKTELQLTHEALALGPYQRDDYQVFLSDLEKQLASDRRREWSANGQKKIIGLNTGCSSVGVPYKKLSVHGQRELISQILSDSRFENANIVLLGGPEDVERNRDIAEGLPVFSSPTSLGLRDGLASVAATDVVFSGDSLGMHMAIGLRRPTVAWFGPTCAHEIDLFDRGEAILSKATCGPCWSRNCNLPVMCYDQVNFLEVRDALARALSAR